MKMTRRNRSIATAILLTVATYATQRSAEAGYIASNLGTGNSFNTSTGYTLSGPSSLAGLGYNLAVEFQITGTSNVVFGSAQLALEFHSGVNSVNVLLMSNDGGLPGTTLQTMSVANISTSPGLYTATATGNTLLTVGTNYWLVAEPTTTTDLTWMQNNQGQSNHLADQITTVAGVVSAWQLATGNPDVAYSISSVPSPDSLPLLGVGLVTFASYRCRRKRRVV